MEVLRDELTDEKYEEMKQIAKNYVCAECGGTLSIHTIPERASISVDCHDPDHHGLIERTTLTQEFRRGAPLHPSIQTNIEKKMLEHTELSRAMNLLALRYPDAIRDPPTAALFIYDCARLGLEPLISPAEAIPIVFRSRRKKRDASGKIITDKEGKPLVDVKETVQMVITGDGWLSMAARGCSEDWIGPPRCIRLEDYLMTLPEHKKRTYEQIKEIALDIKESACKDKDAWFYYAIGKRRGMEEDAVVPGYFTHIDMKKAEAGHLPAATEPGNQAIWRAQKKWVRKVYPECRQRMLELTDEWVHRAGEIKEAQQFIDAEYALISLPEVEEERAARAKGAGLGKRSAVRASETEAEPPPAAERTAEGEGFHIDLQWLEENLKEIKWTQETTKSWLAKEFKVDTQGQLAEVLSRLTREQAEAFTKELQERAAKKQLELFE